MRAVAHRTRAERPADVRDSAGDALAREVLARPEVAAAGTVAVYLSMDSEPPSWQLADGLRERGVTVLAPVVRPRRRLEWAEYTGPEGLRPAAYGILEPAGPTRGAAALTEADVVIVPALAVDRAGGRLGRGAGFYDRALASTRAEATRIALVYDDELVDDIPTEPHDELVDLVVTPSRTWVCHSR